MSTFYEVIDVALMTSVPEQFSAEDYATGSLSPSP